jgi:hypothetical protein
VNLHEQFKAHIADKSDDELIEFFGVTKQTIKNWRSGKTPGLDAVQKLIDAAGASFDGCVVPDPVAPTDVEPPSDLILGTEGASVVIGTPSHGFEHPLTNYCLERLMARYPGKIIRDRTVGTYIHVARNEIATRFLASGAEWLLFVDADMVIPCGDDAFLNDTCGAGIPPQFAKIDALGRMVSHRKGVVSGVYFTRDRYSEGVGVNHKAKTDEGYDKSLHTSVPQARLDVVEWAGAGCLLIHRKVFEAINENFPELAPVYRGDVCVKYGKWFNYEGEAGEDVSFAKRATEAGYPTYLDLSVVCGHIGEAIYWHHNTGVNRPARKVAKLLTPQTPITSGVDSRKYARDAGSLPKSGKPILPAKESAVPVPAPVVQSAPAPAPQPAPSAPPVVDNTPKSQTVKPRTNASVHVSRNPKSESSMSEAIGDVGWALGKVFS